MSIIGFYKKIEIQAHSVWHTFPHPSSSHVLASIRKLQSSTSWKDDRTARQLWVRRQPSDELRAQHCWKKTWTSSTRSSPTTYGFDSIRSSSHLKLLHQWEMPQVDLLWKLKWAIATIGCLVKATPERTCGCRRVGKNTHQGSVCGSCDAWSKRT